ncbi:uncharacterized protein J7T54_000057 [Emericellopsis cladophorae]|uniref:Mid2 domain-containing protein n=1 Tax=Emericellopsis cladophorae TaxID=2686198 RepID=A0A9P9XYV0_9HYPO|nr:uncharacterized protein J7T54_000057 [Emericellopsis cladophorae]KAI6780151.1 hypothetical protein J7T54_000057 [Emericellopsis cladophorae]
MLRPSTPSVSFLLLTFITSTTSSAIPGASLFARQQSCPADGFESCGNDFPDYFCCQEDTKCLSLAGGTTALCCPEGSNCEGMAPITCNLNGQDAEKDFRIPLKTTVFDVPLEKCGDNHCCPHGFSCEEGDDGKECRMNKDQSEKPKKKQQDDDKGSSTTTAATSPTTNPASEPTDTETASSKPTSSSDEAEEADTKKDGGPDITAIVGGVVGACGILVILAVILFICVRRNAKRNPKPSPSAPKPAMATLAVPSSRGGHSRQPSNMSATQPINPRFISYPKRDSFEDIPICTPREAPRVDGLGLLGRSVSGRSLTNPHHHHDHHHERRRDSIPNAFANGSPNPSISDTLPRTPSNASSACKPIRTGTVSSSKLAPIRSMRPTASRHLHPETARHIMLTTPNHSTESINVFTDPQFVVQDASAEDRRTRFSDLMHQADLEGVGSERSYVPTNRTPKRI